MSDKNHPAIMAQQNVLSRIQANERLLKQQAHTVAPDTYEKLVVEHLHLIASMKALRKREHLKK
jgi:hypothetical protein